MNEFADEDDLANYKAEQLRQRAIANIQGPVMGVGEGNRVAQGIALPQPDDQMQAGYTSPDIGSAAQLGVNIGDKFGSPRPQYLASNSPMAVQPEQIPESDLVKNYISSKFQDDLLGARQQASQNTLAAQLGAAGDKFGYAIAGVKPPQDDFYSKMAANANKPVDDFVQNQKLSEYDPQSARSQTYRNILSKFYPDSFNKENTEGLTVADEPLITKLVTAKSSADAKSANSANLLNFRDQQLNERNQLTAHQKVLQGVRNNKALTEGISKAQNLANSINNIEKTGVITAQDMADVQALAIQNMALGGSSSAHERADRYAKTLGISSANALQFLTGTPQDIGKDNPLYDRYKQIIKSEIGNFRDRANSKFDALTSGNKSVYEKRPDLKSDIEDLKQNVLGQLPASDAVAIYPMIVRDGSGKMATVKSEQERLEAEKAGFR